jgi:hypothetical protein
MRSKFVPGVSWIPSDPGGRTSHRRSIEHRFDDFGPAPVQRRRPGGVAIVSTTTEVRVVPGGVRPPATTERVRVAPRAVPPAVPVVRPCGTTVRVYSATPATVRAPPGARSAGSAGAPSVLRRAVAAVGVLVASATAVVGLGLLAEVSTAGAVPVAPAAESTGR